MKNLALGDQIQMGKNATMSWGQVTEQPFIPKNAADVGALPATTFVPDDDYITTISKYAITTQFLNTKNIKAGSIDAENILAGTLTGFLIQTASTGNRIELGNNKYETYNANNQRHGVYMDALGGTSSFRIHDNGEHKFSLFYGTETGDTEKKMRVTATGCPLKISSGVNDMSLTANKIWIEGDVHFGGAATGLKVRLG